MELYKIRKIVKTKKEQLIKAIKWIKGLEHLP